MQIILDLPEDIARHFGTDQSGLSRVALEGLAIEGARRGKLSTSQIRRMLGFSTRMQVDGFLKDHGVMLPVTVADIERDTEMSRRFREQWPSSSQIPRPSTTSS